METLRKISISLLTSAVFSLLNFKLAQAQMPTFALVIDPPSHIRSYPNGPVLCTVENSVNINLFELSKGWYKTDQCQGHIGYIHSSQVLIVKVGLIIDPPSNIRKYPNGPNLCTIADREQIDVYDLKDGWYKVPSIVCNRPGYIHKSQILIK